MQSSTPVEDDLSSGASASPTRQTNNLAANAMGTADLVFTVLAALAPLTLIVAVTPLHFLKGGSAVPGGYLIAGCIMALFAVGYMAISRHVQNAGAFYCVIAKGLGKPIGAGAAAVALVSYNALQISTYGALGVYASDTLAHLTGVTLPWWFYAVGAAMAVYTLGYKGIHTSARVLAIILIGEIAMLVVLAGAVMLTAGHPLPTESFTASNVLQPHNGAMFALIFGAFMGFESTTIFSEEARGGHRTVRRATYMAVGFIAVFYALMSAVIVAAYGSDMIQAEAEKDPINLVVNLFVRFTSPPVVDVMNLLLLGSAFAALLALHNVSNRYFYAMGREGLLPGWLALTHPQRKSPWLAGLLQSSLAVVFIGLTVVCGVDPYLGLLLWGSALGMLGIILLWALCSLAVLVYMRRRPGGESLWTVVIAPTASFLALSVIFVLAIDNIALLTGASDQVNGLLLACGAGAFVLGGARALWMRRAEPLRYEALTSKKGVQP
ncbi:APC family permease [Pseudomonas sp. NPDC087358]|uniref:APC family permease n=1 Tax=Pseudomonas sp. NPDC087358 TaxID=3364439 RepID=UPI00384A749A